jgi:hypothetical protein
MKPSYIIQYTKNLLVLGVLSPVLGAGGGVGAGAAGADQTGNTREALVAATAAAAVLPVVADHVYGDLAEEAGPFAHVGGVGGLRRGGRARRRLRSRRQVKAYNESRLYRNLIEIGIIFELISESEFVNLLRSRGIDSQPYLMYRPARLKRLAELIPRNRFGLRIPKIFDFVHFHIIKHRRPPPLHGIGWVWTLMLGASTSGNEKKIDNV